ncbi:MAG TPA: alkaline phosphatase family protein [Bryobacteraceae bacterium]|nr:alkaline phosphatase family protein [Bryobacteraceae bacterium]
MKVAVTLLLLAALTFAQGPPSVNRTVIIVSLDGFPADALENPKTPVPVLRQLAADGTRARRMTPINPTVTWPNHTAIVTGADAARNGLLVNGKILPTNAWPPVKIEPWVPKDQMVRVPTLYDAAHKAGLRTAQVDWVAIHQAPNIDFAFPEVPSADGTIEREMVRENLVTADIITSFRDQSIFRRDQIWTDASIHILRAHRPNLLLLHLLSLDTTHHSYGPGSLAADGAMAFLDSCVGRLINAVKELGIVNNTTIFVVSDHGFKAVKTQIDANVAIAGAGLQNSAWAMPEGGYALVYTKDHDKSIADRLRASFVEMPGIQSALMPDAYASLRLPTPEQNDQMPDLYLVAAPGYAFANSRGGAVSTTVASTQGAHGYPNSDPELDAIFIGSGAGIQRGRTIDRIANLDVAPTIGALLGIKLPEAQGRVIGDALIEQPR